MYFKMLSANSGHFVSAQCVNHNGHWLDHNFMYKRNSQDVCVHGTNITYTSLKRKGSHIDHFVVISCTWGGHHDHLQCGQWLQISQHDYISVSLYRYYCPVMLLQNSYEFIEGVITVKHVKPDLGSHVIPMAITGNRIDLYVDKPDSLGWNHPYIIDAYQFLKTHARTNCI